MSDLPSQYAEEVETFRQILDLPDPRETLSRSSTTVLGLDDEKGQQELRPRGTSAMLPLTPFSKMLLKNLNKISWPPIYLRVNTSNPQLQQRSTTRYKICISPKPSGTPMGKVPLQVLKELEHQARQNLSTIKLTATFTRTASSCNTVIEKCLRSAKATFRRVRNQILKGSKWITMSDSVRKLLQKGSSSAIPQQFNLNWLP